jgi:hypothetical protein
MGFRLAVNYRPRGDQENAIQELTRGVRDGEPVQQADACGFPGPIIGPAQCGFSYVVLCPHTYPFSSFSD